MRVSIGGDAVRIRISNEYGNKPLRIRSATIAIHNNDASVVAQSTRTLTQNGKKEFTVAIGKSLLTDPANLRVNALQHLAVSVYFAEATGTSTIHTTGLQTAYTCLGEDQTLLPSLRVDSRDDSRYFVTDIEVRTKVRAAAIVIVGDSTSDGVGTSLDSNIRWPDQLANRLQAIENLQHIAVINSGISGNRILNDGLDPFLGPSTMKRFDRDALSKPGVKWIILLQGINDIVASGMFDDPQQKVNADQIIAAMETLIERSHRKNILILGATILPRQGAKGARAHTPAAEAMRQRINAWIRSANGFDAVLDFDKVLRDPDQPDRQLPGYNSGDFTHPNATGYGEMASSIDLGIFNGKGRTNAFH
jgi:lysophospholipase L1-like esterase